MIKLSPHSALTTWDTRAAELTDQPNLTHRNREILRQWKRKRGWEKEKNEDETTKRNRKRKKGRRGEPSKTEREWERGEKRERRREASTNECHIGTLWSCIIQILLPEEAPRLRPITADTHLKSLMPSSLLPVLWNNCFKLFQLSTNYFVPKFTF